MGDTIEPAPCSPRFFSSVQKVFVYTGGVEVAGSNPVSPTEQASGNITFSRGFSCFCSVAVLSLGSSFSL